MLGILLDDFGALENLALDLGGPNRGPFFGWRTDFADAKDPCDGQTLNTLMFTIGPLRRTDKERTQTMDSNNH